MTYISWFIDIGLYLEDSVMYKVVTLAGGIPEPLLTCSSLLIFIIRVLLEESARRPVSFCEMQ